MILQDSYYLYSAAPISNPINVLQNSGTVLVQGSSTNITFTLPNASAGGTTMIILVEGYGPGGVTTPSGWTQYNLTGNSSSNSSESILVLPNSPAGFKSITVACPNYQTYQSGGMIEVSGLTSSTPDLEVNQAYPSQSLPYTAVASSSSNTAYVNELLLLNLSIAQGSIGIATFTLPSGFTTIFNANDDSVDACGVGAYNIVSSIQTSPSISVGISGTDSGANAFPTLQFYSFH